MCLSKKQFFKLVSFLLVVAFVLAMFILYNLNKAAIDNELVNLYLLPRPEKLTELYFNNSADLPGSATDTQVSGTYSGTVEDVSSRVKTGLSLTGVRQSQRNITGNLVLGPGMQGGGAFRGTIDATKHLQFTVTDSTGRASFYFEGVMRSATSLSGSFYRCDPGSAQKSRCDRASKEFGLWNLDLTVSFAFVIHNQETTTYHYVYEVSVIAEGAKHIVDSGSVLLKDGQYFVKNEEFKLMNSSGRQKVVVELINMRQSIDFWIEIT